MGRRYLLWVTALIEWGTGLALLAGPHLVLALLLGVAGPAPELLVVARVAGGALVAIGLSCWAVRNEPNTPAQRGVLTAVLVYDTVAAGALAAAGAGPGPAGVGLWPAVAVHVVLGAWCVLGLVRFRSPAGGLP